MTRRQGTPAECLTSTESFVQRPPQRRLHQSRNRHREAAAQPPATMGPRACRGHVISSPKTHWGRRPGCQRAPTPAPYLPKTWKCVSGQAPRKRCKRAAPLHETALRRVDDQRCYSLEGSVGRLGEQLMAGIRQSAAPRARGMRRRHPRRVRIQHLGDVDNQAPVEVGLSVGEERSIDKLWNGA